MTPIVPIYVALFALILVGLSVRTIRLRRRLRVAVGHGDSALLERAIRAHANFCEYVPLALVLLYCLEARTGTRLAIHALAVTLLAGRLLHAWGVSQVQEDGRVRTVGMAMTLTVMIVAALGVLVTGVGKP